MSDREDRKLREVTVATYQYRHEAEFAAGFLKDAGIPYRLQIDDPALGISMSTPAKIWVAAMDERRARHVLEDGRAVEEPDDGGADAGGRAEPAEAPQGVVHRSWHVTDQNGKLKPDLPLRSRLISLGSGVAVASTLGVDAVRQAGSGVTVGVAVVSAALVLVATFGKAPGFLARILAALSGDAP